MKRWDYGVETTNILHSQCEAQTLNNHNSPNVLYTLLAPVRFVYQKLNFGIFIYKRKDERFEEIYKNNY